MFACNTVSLYTIELMMIIQGIIELGHNIRSAWFLDIRISTCYACTVSGWRDILWQLTKSILTKVRYLIKYGEAETYKLMQSFVRSQ